MCLCHSVSSSARATASGTNPRAPEPKGWQGLNEDLTRYRVLGFKITALCVVIEKNVNEHETAIINTN